MEGIPLSEEMVLKNLKEVIDPELNASVVDLGMVRNLKIQDGIVSFDFTLTTLKCPFRETLVNSTRKKIEGIPGVKEVRINLREMTEDDKRELFKERFQEETIPTNQIKHVVAIMSGKGGVGKSLVTSLLALSLQKAGKKVGILDADITGPSIPRLFGLKGFPEASESGIFPLSTREGLKVISMNFFLEEEGKPVIWRGPLITKAIQQFWSDVHWGDLDFLLVDLPPGTADAPLTVLQSIPVDGVILVTSPQELASVIVRKAAEMSRELGTPILGIVENMSYFTCPHCGKETSLFGTSHAQELANYLGVKILTRLPLSPTWAELADSGKSEEIPLDLFQPIREEILQKLG
ncbi:MAG: Mrp/NBP35 family ATP-binding protein [Caldiserica bacterium]|nr:Mrp/NBP35 family ATP-binding protein [Caldisericota bacterium]MDH7562388.1 Mrp/NBP35 family ATP-binding protein [Caldisericota bacterium]